MQINFGKSHGNISRVQCKVNFQKSHGNVPMVLCKVNFENSHGNIPRAVWKVNFGKSHGNVPMVLCKINFRKSHGNISRAVCGSWVRSLVTSIVSLLRKYMDVKFKKVIFSQISHSKLDKMAERSVRDSAQDLPVSIGPTFHTTVVALPHRRFVQNF